MLESLDLPFVQRGLAELALLSVGAGLIGTWIVLRGLAFYSHAVGTAAFPGLVLADGLGFAAALGALGAALAFAALLALIPRRRGDDRGAETALVLVGLLALGVILASDVFGSSAGVESLLFGSLFLIDQGDLVLAAAISAAALAAARTLGPRWLAVGFDGPEGAARRGARALDAVLLVLIALAIAAAVGALGALLVAALFVVPAATTRLWFSRLGAWQAATIGLCAAVGTAGVLISVELNTPPGATIAVLAGVLFACSALAASLRRAGRGRRLRLATVAAALAAVLAAGCGADGSGSRDGGPAIVATTPVVADLARNVAPPGAAVTALLDAGSDPHDYEPRPDDVRALAEADVVVASGGDLDEWVAGALEDSGSEAKLVVVADSVPHPLAGGAADGDGHGGPVEGDSHGEADRQAGDGHGETDQHAEDGDELDPHWWHDPRNGAAAAREIAAAVGGDGAGYARRIERLDELIATCIASVPASARRVVTDHDAFAYLGARYGIEIVGTVIPALTTDAQASAGDLAELRRTIEREGVRVVFPESSVPAGVADAIARETSADLGPTLYGDTLGPPGSGAETYLGMLAVNADGLVRGMSGGARGCPRGVAEAER